MRILVFSDTHLTLPFDERKYNFLKRIISQADNVIINGDFWEGYQITFEQFINSSWKKMFPLLKAKNAVYIYGNHDKKILSDERVSHFSILQTYQYKLKFNGKEFIFEHGNRLCPFFDDVLKLQHPPFLLARLIDNFGRFLIRKYKKSFIKFIYSRFNKVIKKKIKEQFTAKQILVCGHTHYAELDLKNRFINTGFNKYGLAQYLIIDGDKIIPKEDWYE